MPFHDSMSSFHKFQTRFRFTRILKPCISMLTAERRWQVVWKITCVSLGEFLGPMQEMGVKFKHLGIVARSERLRNLVFYSCKSKTRLKNHETWHGVMTWHQHGAVFFWPNWDKFWRKLLANWSFSQEGSWFWEGTCHLRVRNDICKLPSSALIFVHWQIRPNISILLNFGIIPCSFGLFYTLIEFLGI